MSWSDIQVQTLVNLWKTGQTAKNISRKLGMSRSAVVGKLNRLGLIGNMKRSEKGRRVSAALRASWARRKQNQASA